MPIVHAYMWEGFGAEKSKTLIEGVTRVFEGLGVPKDAVYVVIHEDPKSHWGVGGQACSEKFRDIRP
jgi:4-oxalocrotonate tautomerase